MRTKANKLRYQAEDPAKVAEQRRRYKTAKYPKWKAELAARGLNTCGNPIVPRLSTEEKLARKQASGARWSRENPGKNSARVQRRRARKLEAIGSFTNDELSAIWMRQRGRCATCKCDGKLTIDHIVPLVLGGSNYAVNIQLLCKPCNSSKGAALRAGTQLSVFDRAAQFIGG